MLGLFDYIFCWWFRVYEKHDRHPRIFATVVLTAYQGFTLINLIVFVYYTLDAERPDGKFLIPLVFGLNIFNYFIYRDKDVEEMERRWKKESGLVKKLKFLFLILYLIVVIFLPNVLEISD